jgi:hypothetical protein
MNISLIKRETTGTGIWLSFDRSFGSKYPHLFLIIAGLDMYTENRTLSKFEIMDGAPVRGEAIPVRLFLGGFDLTPTYKDVHNKACSIVILWWCPDVI